MSPHPRARRTRRERERARPGKDRKTCDKHTTRKPMLLFRLFGLFLLRLAERAPPRLRYHDPPRSTRAKSTGGPTGFAAGEFTVGQPGAGCQSQKSRNRR